MTTDTQPRPAPTEDATAPTYRLRNPWAVHRAIAAGVMALAAIGTGIAAATGQRQINVSVGVVLAAFGLFVVVSWLDATYWRRAHRPAFEEVA